MDKFKGLKNVAGYDSHEVKSGEKTLIREDIRDRAKFPAEIQNVLSEMDKLETEETLLRNNIKQIEENLETVNYDLLNNLNERLEKIEDKKEKIYENIGKIFSGNKELARQFKEYVAKKTDREIIEERKFSPN